MRIAKKARFTPKLKKSYTLSRSSVKFLERLHKEKQAPSVSAVLDGIIKDVEEQRKREAIDRAITEYYDNLTDEEERELRAWGDFSMEQMRRTAD